jgi:hypothetical protein
MSLGGFTNFAKNALLTAQKHIDSALHIEEEEEEIEDEQGEEEENASLEDASSSLYESALMVFFLISNFKL